MRLYHHLLSSSARRAVMAALHLGTEVELVEVDLRKDRTPQFLALNPNGKVPVLEDGPFVLWESRAIMQYLADATPGQRIYPQERRARADVDRWLFWDAQHWSPAISVLSWERFIKPMVTGAPADPVEEKRGEALIATLAKVLDAHLATRKWLAQDRVTLADLALSAPLMVQVPARLPLAPYTHVAAWLTRVQELDCWKRTGV